MQYYQRTAWPQNRWNKMKRKIILIKLNLEDENHMLFFIYFLIHQFLNQLLKFKSISNSKNLKCSIFKGRELILNKLSWKCTAWDRRMKENGQACCSMVKKWINWAYFQLTEDRHHAYTKFSPQNIYCSKN